MNGLFRNFRLCWEDIALQTPAVVGQKVDIPLALITLLLNTDILVKELTLFCIIETIVLDEFPNLKTITRRTVLHACPSYHKWNIGVLNVVLVLEIDAF